ncbi:MAG: hypothetical protein ACE5J2_05680 [Nitrososphaerales archaeon]
MEIESTDLNRFAVLFLVLSGASRIAERTQIQKMAYIVNESGWNAVEDYKWIARGPWSQWLDSQLDSLIDAGMVDETEESILIGTDNEAGFWCYSLTTKGKSLVKSVFDSINEPKLIDHSLKLLYVLSKYTEEDLDIVSSILYASRDKDLDLDRVVRTTASFRPQYTEERIRKYLDDFKRTRDKIRSS